MRQKNMGYIRKMEVTIRKSMGLKPGSNKPIDNLYGTITRPNEPIAIPLGFPTPVESEQTAAYAKPKQTIAYAKPKQTTSTYSGRPYNLIPLSIKKK